MRAVFVALALLIPTVATAQNARENLYSTRSIRTFGLALTAGGEFGAPRYTTTLRPTCNTANLGAIIRNTTTNTFQGCDGSSWASLGVAFGGASGGTATRVLFTDGSGNLADDSDFTFATDRVTATKLGTTAIGAANAVDLGETAGCITFEGSSADDIEGRLCITNPTGGDSVYNLPNAATTVTLASISQSQTFTGTQTFSTAIAGISAIEAVTTTKTTTANEGLETYTNTGDTDGATITLLNDPTAGAAWHFAVTVAQTLTIVPSTGESLYMGTDQCNASMTANAIGATVTIRAVTGGSGGVFMAFGASGWTCND